MTEKELAKELYEAKLPAEESLGIFYQDQALRLARWLLKRFPQLGTIKKE